MHAGAHDHVSRSSLGWESASSLLHCMKLQICVDDPLSLRFGEDCPQLDRCSRHLGLVFVTRLTRTSISRWWSVESFCWLLATHYILVAHDPGWVVGLLGHLCGVLLWTVRRAARLSCYFSQAGSEQPESPLVVGRLFVGPLGPQSPAVWPWKPNPSSSPPRSGVPLLFLCPPRKLPGPVCRTPAPLTAPSLLRGGPLQSLRGGLYPGPAIPVLTLRILTCRHAYKHA